MSRPNFFIVGAPKCGTTSLYAYLREHPQVFMCEPKEPEHFSGDLDWRGHMRAERVSDLDDYLALFSEADDAVAVGEASTWSLFSRAAAERIYAFDPDANVIIMLREPVSMMYSLHGQYLKDGNESIEDFEHALAAEPDRRAGRRIPASSHLPVGLQYTAVASYQEQVRRYLERFGRDRVLIIRFDRFSRDTPREYRRVLAFLGLDLNYYPDFHVKNVASLNRNIRVKRFFKRHRVLAAAMARVLPITVRRRIGDLIQPWASQVRRHPLDPALAARLRREFQREVRELGNLIDEDLRDWINGD